MYVNNITTMETVDFDKFFGKVLKANNCFRITVPKQIIEGSGYKVGDNVKVIIRKIEVQKDETKN